MIKKRGVYEGIGVLLIDRVIEVFADGGPFPSVESSPTAPTSSIYGAFEKNF